MGEFKELDTEKKRVITFTYFTLIVVTTNMEELLETP